MSLTRFACFMKEVVRPKKNATGAIAPSGKSLAKAMVEMAQVPFADTIVELGPGTGVFTEEILRAKKPSARLYALEVNEKFVEATRKRCPEAVVYHESAQNISRILGQAGHEYCDAIISGHPWTIFPKEMQRAILDVVYESLRPGGLFVTFSYLLSPLTPSGRRFFVKALPQRFEQVQEKKYIWKNVPPCMVYCVRKPEIAVA